MTEPNKATGQQISIQGADVTRIEYRGEPVVTFAQVDEVHERPEGTASRNFRENRDRFIEADDFIELTADEIRRQSLQSVFPPRTPKGIILTRRGYLKLTKPMNDDRAWKVQGEMIDRYFMVEQAQAAPLPNLTTSETLLQMIQLQIETERRQAAQDLAIADMGLKVDRIEKAQTIMSSRPSNAEGITHLRARVNRSYGLSTNVIDEVMRQSPYAPKPAGMVRNDHVDAEGAPYAVYWIKDVTKTFDRFVDECKPVTAFLFTHPFIEGRFRVARKQVVA